MMRLSIYNKNVGFTVTVVVLFVAFSFLSYNVNAFSTTTPLCTSNGFSPSITNNNNNSFNGPRRKESRSRQLLLSLNMQKQGRNQEDNQRQKLSLSVSASELLDYDYNYDYDIIQKTTASIPEPSLLESFILPVASASLMITGNTVGAGMLALPAVVAGPGPILSFGVMIGAWMMCLMSGLTIAQVAIQEHESNGGDVPSSFKEFAEATLPPSAANTVSGTSVFINTLILAFNIFTAGQIGSSLLPSVLPFDSSFLPLLAVDDAGTFLSYLFAGGLFCIISSQSLKNLSQVCSILVMGLFGTFAGLLLPGLSNISDPMSILTSSSLPKEELGDGMLLMIPVVVSILIFQNIVPTITRLLDYDRLKVKTALTCGSMIPLLMYMAWTIAVLGGGIDMASTSSSSSTLGGLMTCFSMITVMGSSLGGSMSLSEEFEILNNDSSNSETKTNTFSLPSVAIPVGISLVLSQIFASDITDTLKIAGSFGSPILYGIIPVSMILMQRQNSNTNDSNDNNIIPGGVLGLGVLALGSTALVGTELFETIRNGTI